MNVTISPDLEKKIRDLVESGRYASATEAVNDALRNMPEPGRGHRKSLDELTLEAIEQVDRGFARELTPEVWADVRAKSERMLAGNEPVPWYITGEDA